MNRINLWETKMKDKYIFFNSLEEYFKYLDDNNLEISFLTKEGFNSEAPCEDIIDNFALRNNVEVTYTDETHPIAFINKAFQSTWINPVFFEKHKEEFKAYTRKKVIEAIKKGKSTIIIPDYILDEDIIKEIINSKDKDVFTIFIKEYDKNLIISEELTKLIKDNYLEAYISKRNERNKKISSKYLISFYTKKELTEIGSLTLNTPLDETTINHLIHVNTEATITLSPPNKDKNDEKKYYEYLINIFNILKQHNRNYNISIEVNNRELFRQSNLLNILPNNINLTIQNDLYKYDIETYQQEEDKLEKLIAPIRNSDLSPFEKYLAVYNLVKKFKPYRENDEDLEKSRYLRYILADGNEYIVCVGFSKLLEDLLNRVGIPNQNMSVGVDISYDDGFTQEEKNIERAGHQRNIIKIDDDKYNIHGIYVVDSTWDNDMENDFYYNSLLTFDRKKEAYRLEFLNDYDLLLDYHNFEDFKAKMDYLMKKTKKDDFHVKIKKTEKEKIIETYTQIYKKICEILKCLDYQKYSELYNKYNEYFSQNVFTSNGFATLDEADKIASQMLTEYAYYIMQLSNKTVKLSTILEAATEVKRKIDGLSDEEITIWLNETKQKHIKNETKVFPYKYDHSVKKEAYLEERTTTEHTR